MAIRRFFQSSGVRKALLVALVIVVLLTGIPVLVGGSSMESCPDCGPVTMPCVVPCGVLPTAVVAVVVTTLALLPVGTLRAAEDFVVVDVVAVAALIVTLVRHALHRRELPPPSEAR